MPFYLPVVHKFGIISQAHKRELQQRLLKRRIELEQEAAIRKESTEKFDLHITEEFVNKYNECSANEKPILDGQCTKIFEKIKRKLNNADQVDDLNLQISWAELSQLVQCNSVVQEECLNVFIMSLENSRLNAAHIPTLFFLAETFIYWLRIDTINQPYLRALEIKLLKVTQLVFQRLYYHYIEGQIDDNQDLKLHLIVYLDGFENSEGVYTPYPDALLYMRYIIAVGKLILKDEFMALKHTANMNNNDEVKSVSDSFGGVENQRLMQKPIKTTPLTVNSRSRVGGAATDTTYVEMMGGDRSSSLNEALNVHELSPLLWHSVDLYLTIIEKCHASAIEDAAFSLIECSFKINEDHW